ncbi:DUF305 domain-containing protein [Gordonia paraffinivorans]|uniref:DUF305 domain-containing protein n=2 Tax=Gordonia paraffinivorans TaxID=175628 RepID=A0ABQ0INE1_9ACTN|nr:DUF305 domain-containing protein [Gordonia paraffinivorans]MCD2147448.1 DUF305 domain-containing protein [Gordonia paraffinivorans]GAC85076.1 hypothetical protein GP2_029_00430 [Gordonia paraffinivorans NBRC 108238]VFA90509.1 Uncharacterized protein conserved in bacteria [Gordonia paraffinivorans]
MSETPEGTAPATEPAPAPRRRTALLALAGVAILLVGVGLGLLIQASLDDDKSDAETPGPAAVGFAQDMIRHHEQGVEMAAIELEHGTDPQVRSMAFDILTTQSNEIGQMQSWLVRWGKPINNPGEPMDWMGHGSADSSGEDHGDHGAGGHVDHGSTPSNADAEQPAMPGMATSAEMERFRAMRGPEVDTTFLQLMLRHHEGGLHMMEYAANPANVSQPYVREMAAGMERTQEKEIGIIKAMLAERDARPLPMN